MHRITLVFSLVNMVITGVVVVRYIPVADSVISARWHHFISVHNNIGLVCTHVCVSSVTYNGIVELCVFVVYNKIYA